MMAKEGVYKVKTSCNDKPMPKNLDLTLNRFIEKLLN